MLGIPSGSKTLGSGGGDGCKFSKALKKVDVATAIHYWYAHLDLLMTFSLNVDFLASQTHGSYSRISAKRNESFKILLTKDYGL